MRNLDAKTFFESLSDANIFVAGSFKLPGRIQIAVEETTHSSPGKFSTYLIDLHATYVEVRADHPIDWTEEGRGFSIEIGGYEHGRITFYHSHPNDYLCIGVTVDEPGWVQTHHLELKDTSDLQFRPNDLIAFLASKGSGVEPLHW